MFVRLSLILLTATCFSDCQMTAAADNDSRRNAVECQVRGGLPNLVAKLNAGNEQPIRIGYLGGSITAAPGWRVKTLAWLEEAYPQANLSEINAAIGGTGSDLGVFRLEQDVLRHQPDVIFIEFAVNDGGAPSTRIHQAMEGIVRQTWKLDPTIDVCFVYTLQLNMLDDMKAGRCSRSASAMEELADFYEIPSINFGVEVAKLESAGTLIFKGDKDQANASDGPMVFSTDGVHPLVNTGHELYLEAFVRSFERIKSVNIKPASHELASPMREDNWEAAKLVALDNVDLRGDWKKLNPAVDTMAKRFSSRLPQMYLASTAGSSIDFKYRGSFAGIYDLVGPDCGQVVVEVDKQSAKTVRRIDGYCTYSRLSKMVVASGADANSIHSVHVELDDEVPDKATILFERNRADLEKNPAKYEGTNWYVGSVMLIGELE